MPPVGRLISLGVIATLVVGLGIAFYHVLAPFLLPLFLAWIVAIVCRPLYLWTVRKTRDRPRWAAGLTTAGVLLVVLLPIIVGVVVAAAQLLSSAEAALGPDARWREGMHWQTALDRVTRHEQVVRIARMLEPYLSKVPEDVELDRPVRGRGEVRAVPVVPVPEAEERLDGPGSIEGVVVEGETPAVVAPAPVIEEGSAEETVDTNEGVDEEGVDEAGREADLASNEAARQRLRERIDASLRATLRYVGTQTIGVLSEVPGIAIGFVGRLVSLLVAIVMFAIGLYYFLCDGPELLETAEKLIPIQSDYQRELLDRFDLVVRAVVLSTFLSALAQGLLTTAALGLAGFHHLTLLFLLASLAAMIPMAGTPLVWVPCVLWLVFQDQAYWAAVLVSLFCVGVVGTVDNVIRTYILNTNARLHPLLAFVSVLGGLHVMGLWGVFIGPIVAACLHALIQIFNAEIKKLSTERSAMELVAEGGAVLDTSSAASLSPVAAEEGRKGTPEEAKPEAQRSGRRKRSRR